jgi:hypothetical protein
MMSRPKTPAGKRVTICIKVSEEDAAVIDQARGTRSRSDWGREALLEHAAPRRPVRPRPPTRVVTAAALAKERAQDRREPGCPHPKARIAKGLCNACGTYVGAPGKSGEAR